MHANIVDLRYRMSDVLNALNRNEEVIVSYRGKEKAVLVPIRKKKTISIKKHPFFGMLRDEKRSVEEMMADLRGERYGDI